MKQKFNKSAEGETQAAQMILRELESEYGDPSSMFNPYKEIMGVRLLATTADVLKEEVTAIIEIESRSQNQPSGMNSRMRSDFSVTSADMARLRETAPARFRDGLEAISRKIAEQVEQHFPGRAAKREKERMRRILDNARQVKKSIPAPQPASFAKRGG